MKNIQIFTPDKYKTDEYEEIEENIYLRKAGTKFVHEAWVTSLSFEQEPELGEGNDSSFISQYPLEDLLDHFNVAVEDFYETENATSGKTCYLEFFGGDPDEIRDLLTIVGKHVYNKHTSNTDQNDGSTWISLEIE